MAKDNKSQTTIDIGHFLDQSKFNTFQKLVVFFSALAIILDGFDSQLIGYALPVLTKEWGVTRDDFVPAVFAGVFGMGVGSGLSGIFADRFGRRWALMINLAIFGLFTIFVGSQNSIMGIAIFRFIAGVGIGGALPIATTIAAEFTPQRYRTMIITSTIVCVPLGGMLAGVFSNVIMHDYGWRVMFYLGGLMPVLLLGVAWFILPETPKYLVRFPERWDELRATVRRVGTSVPEDTVFTDVAEQKAEKNVGYSALFKDGFAYDSAAIWCAFFFCLLAVYAAFSWLPVMVTSINVEREIATRALMYYNLGGVFGALACAWLITKYGSYLPLVFCSIGGALSAFAIILFDIQSHIVWFLFLISLHGLFVNAVQSTMYAVCAYIYPTRIRATGTAGALMFGRVGAIAAAASGAPVISHGGSVAFLSMLGGAMVIVTVSLMLIRRHIPKPETAN